MSILNISQTILPTELCRSKTNDGTFNSPLEAVCEGTISVGHLRGHIRHSLRVPTTVETDVAMFSLEYGTDSAESMIFLTETGVALESA